MKRSLVSPLVPPQTLFLALLLAFITLAVLGLALPGVARTHRVVILSAIGGFWLLHGIAYIIERYRDPVMPLLIVLAAGALAEIVTHRMTQRDTAHAA